MIASVSETTNYNLRHCSPVADPPTGATYRIWLSHIIPEALPSIDWPPSPDIPWDNADGAETYYSFFVEDGGGRHTAVVWDQSLLGSFVRMTEGVTVNLANRDGSSIKPIDVNIHFDGRDFITVSGDLYDYDYLMSPSDHFRFTRTFKWPGHQLPTHTSKAHSSIVSQDGSGNRFRVIFYWQTIADLYD
jgi:hypothetical protein